MMKATTKGLLATLTAGAVALGSVTPAAAADRYRDYHRDRGGISAGEVIAGAVVLGGLAAILSSADRDRYDYRDRRYDDRRAYRYDNPREAVERCVRAAEVDARRAGYRYADVTEVSDVDRTRYGFRVEGRLRVEDTGRYSRHDRYDRYDRRDRWDGGYSDAGRFSCFVEGGRVRDVDYRSIRGLG